MFRLKRPLKTSRLIFQLIVVGAFCASPTISTIAMGGSSLVVPNQTGDPTNQRRAHPLSWGPDQPSDLIKQVVTCGDTAFLLSTPRLGTVYIADLLKGHITGSIGKAGRGPNELTDAASIAADCSRKLLYVVQITRGVSVFSLTDGKYLRTYAAPETFQPSSRSSARLLQDGSRLYVSGLWPKQKLGYLKKPKDQMYQDVRFGWSLSLKDDRGEPFVVPIESGCVADQSTCLNVAMDRFADGAWVVGQPGASKVGIYGPSANLTNVIEVSSPKYLHTGPPLTWTDRLDREMAWNRVNSVVHGLYAFGDTIAVVHARFADDWKRGQAPQFKVFMNLVSRDGRKLRSDVPLPGLPVGRDEREKRNGAGTKSLLRT